MADLIFKEEAYKIIGISMEVHRNLGKGFSEIVYKDALEYEFNKSNILYEREKKYKIKYNDIILPHYYYADFVVFDKIILEAKCVSAIVDEHINQTLNYLAVSKCKLGLIVNFSKQSLEYKRAIL
ncbi:MAG: GxxExxY protein [Bacteroidota bacterium]